MKVQCVGVQRQVDGSTADQLNITTHRGDIDVDTSTECRGPTSHQREASCLRPHWASHRQLTSQEPSRHQQLCADHLHIPRVLERDDSLCTYFPVYRGTSDHC